MRTSSVDVTASGWAEIALPCVVSGSTGRLWLSIGPSAPTDVEECHNVASEDLRSLLSFINPGSGDRLYLRAVDDDVKLKVSQ